MKNVQLKVLKGLACFSLMMTVLSVNQTCMYWIHQPPVPDKAKKYRRF